MKSVLLSLFVFIGLHQTAISSNTALNGGYDKSEIEYIPLYLAATLGCASLCAVSTKYTINSYEKFTGSGWEILPITIGGLSSVSSFFGLCGLIVNFFQRSSSPFTVLNRALNSKSISFTFGFSLFGPASSNPIPDNKIGFINANIVLDSNLKKLNFRSTIGINGVKVSSGYSLVNTDVTAASISGYFEYNRFYQKLGGEVISNTTCFGITIPIRFKNAWIAETGIGYFPTQKEVKLYFEIGAGYTVFKD